MTNSIHSSAIIHPSAQIGTDVEIGPYTVIGENVRLGNRCRILGQSRIEFTTLGEDCVVYPFAAIGTPPQHMGYKNEPSRVEIGSRCTFREGVTIHRGSPFDQSLTSIGDDCYFMAESHVAHDCRVGNNVVMVNAALLGGHVIVEDRVFISALAAVHQRCRVGKLAMVSGQSAISMDVAPYATVQGDRAHLYGLNLVGLKRAGFSRDSIKTIKAAFRELFYSQKTVHDALNNPIFDSTDPHLIHLREFMKLKNRGYIRPPKSESPSVDQEQGAFA